MKNTLCPSYLISRVIFLKVLIKNIGSKRLNMLYYNLLIVKFKRFYYYYNYKGALGQFGPGLIPGNFILFIFRQY